MSFDRSVNEVVCHGIPDQRVLVEGDIVNLGEVSLIFSQTFMLM
jgi:methionine aminopeptidase